MARRAYSVEHNEPWCKKMQQKLAAKGLTNRISYKCESVPAGTGGWGIANAFEEGDYKVRLGTFSACWRSWREKGWEQAEWLNSLQGKSGTRSNAHVFLCFAFLHTGLQAVRRHRDAARRGNL